MSVNQVFFGALFLFTSLGSLAVFAQVPDPAPTTPVDEVILPAFEPTREEAVLEAYIDGIVDAHMREHKIPGVSLSVVKNGKTLFAKGYGYSDVEARKRVDGTDSLFRIGSLSKTFIWTSVMILVERGDIDLDTDVNQYLKDLTIPDAFDAPITMNDLMGLRAGFEDTIAVFTVDEDEKKSITQILNETMPARVFAPGARTSYSNWGSVLAAKIIEDISGKTYAEFLQTEILTPLGMTSTSLYGPGAMDEALRGRLAKGYKIDGGTFGVKDYMRIGAFAPAGSMSLSAADAAIWMQFHLGGGAYENVRLLSPQTHAAMWTRHFTDTKNGGDLARGFMNRDYKGVEVFEHGGAVAAFFTNFTLMPELQAGIYLSQNSDTSRNLVRQLAPLVIDHLIDERGAVLGDIPALQDVDLSEYAGAYVNNRRSFTQFERAFSLAPATIITSADNGLIVSGDSASLYRPVPGAEDTFENDFGERMVFGRNETGEITHYTENSGVHSHERVAALGNPQTFLIVLAASVFFSVTTLVGAWRRQGRPVTHSAIGRVLNVTDFALALIILGFTGLGAAAFIEMSSIEVSQLKNYPMASVTFARFAGYLVFASALVAVAGLAHSWLKSGWGIWRKLHHTMFVFSVAVFAILLVYWRVIFSGIN